VGRALWGTLQTMREKFHSRILVDQIRLTDPLDATRLSEATQQIGTIVSDPAIRAAQGASLLAQQVTREANVLAFNDIFLIIAGSASMLFLWSILVELRMRRTGEISPVVRFGQRVAELRAPPSGARS